MRTMIRRLIFALSLVLAATAARAQGTAGATAPPLWTIDASRSDVRFTVTKFGFEDVTGVFRESDGEIRYDASQPSRSSMRWRVRVASVLTDAPNRDRALLAPEYFDAARYPYLIFVSRSVRGLEHGGLEVTGDVTMRGVTRPMTLVVRPGRDAAGPTFETSFEIDRYDFGIRGGSVMGRLIGRRVRVRVLAATCAPVQEAR